MPDKRVMDVSGDYEDRNAPAGDAEISRIRRQATPLGLGKLERDVDELLRAKGADLNEPLGEKALHKLPARGRRGLRRRRA